MIIIKFGGSIITDKSKKGVYNTAATRQLLGELRNAYEEKKEVKKNKKMSEVDLDYNLILVHGAGSFGHISARKYQLDFGYRKRTQLIGLSEVHRDVRDLNLKFMNDLLLFGFPGISIPPMVTLRNRARVIKNMDTEIFRRVLDMHCIPVTFGDVVPDDAQVFSICSGDSIIKRLADVYRPSRVIFISNVDGLYTSNPELDPNAELIPILTQKSFSNAITTKNTNPDVTGSIYLKSKIALALAQRNIETYIINGKIKGRLSAAIGGEKVIATIARA